MFSLLSQFTGLISLQVFSLQVKATILTIEADQVQKGIVDLVNKHGIRKLVMGAMPDK